MINRTAFKAFLHSPTAKVLFHAVCLASYIGLILRLTGPMELTHIGMIFGMIQIYGYLFVFKRPKPKDAKP